jgi:TetR/AcrR family transcriptional regulator
MPRPLLRQHQEQKGKLMYIMPFDARLDARRVVSDSPPEYQGNAMNNVYEAIIQAASEAFAHEGYAATTVESIALRAGLPKSNVLYYFKSKDNLYAQVLDEIATRYLDACTPFTEHEEPMAAMSRQVSGMIRMFQQRPSASRVFMIEIKQKAPRLPSAYLEQWTAQVRQSVACLRNWIDRGLLAPVDPDHLLLTLGAVAQSCISLGWQLPGAESRSGFGHIDFEAALSNATRLLRGLTPDVQSA